jgi:hypothetical protein
LSGFFFFSSSWCSAVRTAIGKAKRGAFKDTHPTDLLAAVLKAVVERVKLDPKLVEDISVGNVLPPGGVSASFFLFSFFFLSIFFFFIFSLSLSLPPFC